MSQMTATARVAPRTPQRRGSAPRPLRAVPGAAGHPGSGAFAALCTALLVGGLMALLMLNTALAQGSFKLHDLQATSGELTDAQGALTSAIDAQRAPAALASRAAGLGMVPATTPAFLRLRDGKVLGVARPAKRGAGFTVVTAPTPPSAKGATPPAAGPQTTVTTKGDITTTTVTTPRAGGQVEKTVTSVNARTKVTTSTTTITKSTKTSASAKPPAPKPAGTPATAGAPRH